MKWHSVVAAARAALPALCAVALVTTALAALFGPCGAVVALSRALFALS